MSDDRMILIGTMNQPIIRSSFIRSSIQVNFGRSHVRIMRPVGAVLAVVIMALTGTFGSDASSPPDIDQTFRVATFNIHKGANRQGHYDLERTIDAIGRLDADLVGVQEAMRNHPDFNCDDQPALIAEGLSRRSGRRWAHVRARAWNLDDRRCLARGRGSDAATEELAFIAASPILSSRTVRLSEGRVGLAVRVRAMPDVPVIVTHLAANRQNQRDRIHELAVLLPWAAQQGPGLLIGDFNAQPDAEELGPVKARYRDAWAEAASRGRAGGVASGSTRPFGRVSRIDYVLYEPTVRLAVDSVEVVDVSASSPSGEVSDHHPVVATFRRAPAPTRAAGTR
jgi:endonuclease/exonuclease/phosphatase family metal-dependent hydrolase